MSNYKQDQIFYLTTGMFIKELTIKLCYDDTWGYNYDWNEQCDEVWCCEVIIGNDCYSTDKKIRVKKEDLNNAKKIDMNVEDYLKKILKEEKIKVFKMTEIIEKQNDYIKDLEKENFRIGNYNQETRRRREEETIRWAKERDIAWANSKCIHLQDMSKEYRSRKGDYLVEQMLKGVHPRDVVPYRR